MSQLYSETSGVVTAEDGTEIQIVIKNVDLDPGLAKYIFDLGVKQKYGGEYHWKHQVWDLTQIEADLGIEFALVQAAARFYYGWNGENETLFRRETDGHLIFRAYYCC